MTVEGLTFKLSEAATVPCGTLQQVEVLVVLVVFTAGLQLVGGETLPQSVEILRLPLRSADVTLETGD